MIQKKFFNAILLLSPLLMGACDNSLKEDKRNDEEKIIEALINSKKWTYTKSEGVYHVVVQPSYGYEVNYGDTVTFWYKGYTIQSPVLVFDTNIKSEAVLAKLDTNTRTLEPVRVIAGKTKLIEGLKRGLLLCRQGQKSTIFFTSDIGFGDNQVGPLPPWTPLAYDIEVVALNGRGIESEQNIIKSMDLTGYTLHSSGLYYRYLLDSSTVRPLSNSVVYGWYSISLTDGTVVTQTPGANEKVDLTGQMPEALRLGFQLASLGGKITILAPSPLGYGKSGSSKVMPYVPIVVDIRLDSIK